MVALLTRLLFRKGVSEARGPYSSETSGRFVPGWYLGTLPNGDCLGLRSGGELISGEARSGTVESSSTELVEALAKLGDAGGIVPGCPGCADRRLEHQRGCSSKKQHMTTWWDPSKVRAQWQRGEDGMLISEEQLDRQVHDEEVLRPKPLQSDELAEEDSPPEKPVSTPAIVREKLEENRRSDASRSQPSGRASKAGSRSRSPRDSGEFQVPKPRPSGAPPTAGRRNPPRASTPSRMIRSRAGEDKSPVGSPRSSETRLALPPAPAVERSPSTTQEPRPRKPFKTLALGDRPSDPLRMSPRRSMPGQRALEMRQKEARQETPQWIL